MGVGPARAVLAHKSYPLAGRNEEGYVLQGLVVSARILEADALEGDAIIYRFRNGQGIGGLLDPGLQIEKLGGVNEEEAGQALRMFCRKPWPCRKAPKYMTGCPR